MALVQDEVTFYYNEIETESEDLYLFPVMLSSRSLTYI